MRTKVPIFYSTVFLIYTYFFCQIFPSIPKQKYGNSNNLLSDLPNIKSTIRKKRRPFLFTVGENIISTTKIRNNYDAIQSLIFLYFSLLLLVKLSLFASHLVSVLCFFFDGLLSKTIAIAIVVALSRS